MRHLLLLTVLCAFPAAAQNRKNVLETLSAALETDQGYSPVERQALLSAIKTRFADYGLQIVNAQRAKALPVILHILTEGSFDQAPPDRVAEVAFSAYQAMSRGSDPEVVSGVALYGYRKNVSADTLSTWANGYKQLVDGGVPGDVAADLVRLAMEENISDSDFNILKWSLVDGVKNGFDSKDYASYLFGHFLEGKAKPGSLSSQAKTAFLKARRAKTKPAIPDYKGVFVKVPPPAPVYVPPAPKPLDEKPLVANSVEERSIPAPTPKPLETPKPPNTPKPADTVGSSPGIKLLWPGLDRSARSYLGTPYVWGGMTREGIDCSALTQNTYGENRVKIPRVSRDQWKTGEKTQSLREGDLVFFNTMGAGVSHVAMVVDPKKKTFIHASSSKGVMIADLDNKWFSQRYLGARRVVP